MDSEASPQSSAIWYMRGSRPSDQPPVTHATEPRGDGVFAALCDDRPVVPAPGRFDPAEDGACAQCSKMAM